MYSSTRVFLPPSPVVICEESMQHGWPVEFRHNPEHAYPIPVLPFKTVKHCFVDPSGRSRRFEFEGFVLVSLVRGGGAKGKASQELAHVACAGNKRDTGTGTATHELSEAVMKRNVCEPLGQMRNKKGAYDGIGKVGNGAGAGNEQMEELGLGQDLRVYFFPVQNRPDDHFPSDGLRRNAESTLHWVFSIHSTMVGVPFKHRQSCRAAVPYDKPLTDAYGLPSFFACTSTCKHLLRRGSILSLYVDRPWRLEKVLLSRESYHSHNCRAEKYLPYWYAAAQSRIGRCCCETENLTTIKNVCHRSNEG
ncbi:unnamed protein product [Tuber aestivum]|uniref:Uncharacterized protein n=1 Tax=Tuber aestivum TaxID=59557 RepID=A0A292PKC4_9PEZI|nr:unnamed protein product [Tuber aestivum]